MIGKPGVQTTDNKFYIAIHYVGVAGIPSQLIDETVRNCLKVNSDAEKKTDIK